MADGGKREAPSASIASLASVASGVYCATPRLSSPKSDAINATDTTDAMDAIGPIRHSFPVWDYFRTR